MECKAFKYNYTVEVLPTRINMTNFGGLYAFVYMVYGGEKLKFIWQNTKYKKYIKFKIWPYI